MYCFLYLYTIVGDDLDGWMNQLYTKKEQRWNKLKRMNDDYYDECEDEKFHPFQDIKKSWFVCKLPCKIMCIGILVAAMIFIFYQDNVAQEQYYYFNSAHAEYDNGNYDLALTYLDQYLDGGNRVYWFMQKVGDKYFSRRFETVEELRAKWSDLSDG